MSQPDSLSDIRFTVIRVKTVNDLQSNADVVELACVKIQNQRIAGTLHMQFSPGQALPEEFTRKTGIYSRTLKDKPALESVLPEIAEFVGRDVILWANSPGRTNAVHRYFKLTQPRDRQFFLAHLSQKLLPELPRHGLNQWAERFGLESDGLSRTENAAIISAKVFLNFLELLRKQGVESYSGLLDFCPAVSVRVKRTRNDLAFDRARLKEYPTRPGVYFMKNRTGDILYVGKAKNLRNRLRSYFQKQSKLPPKIAAMMRQVAMIDVTEVGSELEALILESRLIKQLQPFYNKKIKNFQRMVFMTVSVNETFPRVSMSPDSDNPDNAYFGPFQRASSVLEKLEVLNRVFQLRDCTDKTFNEHRKNPCMRFELGLCSGPCAGKISEGDYRARVADFLRYLAEEPCDTVAGLIAKRDAYTEALLFEKAALVQERLARLEQLQLTSHRLIQAVERQHYLLVLPALEPDAVRLLSVIQGQPSQWKTVHLRQTDWDEVRGWIQAELNTLAAVEALPQQAIPKVLYEEARLISQWLDQRERLLAAGEEAPDGHVIAMAGKSADEILSELLLIASPEVSRSVEMLAELDEALNEAEEAWHWERGNQG